MLYRTVKDRLIILSLTVPEFSGKIGSIPTP